MHYLLFIILFQFLKHIIQSRSKVHSLDDYLHTPENAYQDIEEKNIHIRNAVW